MNMSIEQYAELALRTNKDMDTQVLSAVHAALGMAGEAGEVVDIVKKSFAYGRDLDKAHLVEELGDALWYVNLMIHVLGTTWDEVLTKNIAKLQARYPEGYTDFAALNRDLFAEQEVLGRN